MEGGVTLPTWHSRTRNFTALFHLELEAAGVESSLNLRGFAFACVIPRKAA
jgi:hypothetical protein